MLKSLPRLSLLLAFPVLLAARGVQARENVPGDGAAIAPAFSIQQSTLRPGEDVTLLACVVNENPHARHLMAPGDAFRFTFRAGDVAGCREVDVISPNGTFEVSDFACVADAHSVSLVYLGAESPWPLGDGACAAVGYHSPTASTTVLTAVAVGQNGAYASRSPTTLLLSVHADLGSIGPAGPSGPPGPPGADGATGESAIGARQIVHTTGTVRALECEPPILVPGLDTSISTEAGSSLLVVVDLFKHVRCWDADRNPAEAGRIDLVLDGVVVTSRSLSSLGGAASLDQEDDVGMAWLSGALTRGAHSLRVTLVCADPCLRPDSPAETYCLGAAEGEPQEGRLVIVELRQ